MTEWTDDNTLRKMIAQIVEKELKNQTGIVPQHLAGNKYRVPPVMQDWMDKYVAQYTADTQYVTNVGFGPMQMVVRWYFKGNGESITMEFSDPYGARMFVLELLRYG